MSYCMFVIKTDVNLIVKGKKHLKGSTITLATYPCGTPKGRFWKSLFMQSVLEPYNTEPDKSENKNISELDNKDISENIQKIDEDKVVKRKTKSEKRKNKSS